MSELVPIEGTSVLFVMAVEAEYGQHLRKLFKPLICGVGPVEAAVALSAKLARLEAQSRLPDLVLSLGSAGSRTLEQTGIYQVSHVSYRDMDATALGFAKGQTPFLDLPPVIELPCAFPDLPKASLATGASVVSGVAYDGIAADMVDMETYGLLRATQMFGVPLIGLRGISDGAKELRHVDDWREFLHLLDEKLAVVVEGLGAVIGEFRKG